MEGPANMFLFWFVTKVRSQLFFPEDERIDAHLLSLL